MPTISVNARNRVLYRLSVSRESRRSAIAPFYVMDVWKAAAERARSHGDVLMLAAGQPSTQAPAPVLRAT